MHQTWQNLLFLHWPIDPALLRPLIPAPLEIDTFEGSAWIGITPFEMTDVHLTGIPPIPGLSSLLELNVRTYVHHEGKPGVWFFSLDSSKAIPAIAARIFFQLPYYKAEMNVSRLHGAFRFASRRSIASEAKFEASWRTGVRLRDPDAHSLAFFLVERYCLYAGTESVLTMSRIYHHPWILDEAVDVDYRSSMLSPLNLPEPASEPLAHFSGSLDVEIWEPVAVM